MTGPALALPGPSGSPLAYTLALPPVGEGGFRAWAAGLVMFTHTGRLIC